MRRESIYIMRHSEGVHILRTQGIEEDGDAREGKRGRGRMNYDKKCKWHKSCGYDFCHGEGICPEFEKGKPPKETEKESEVKHDG